MQLTETALARIRATLADAPPDSAIRITVQGGGCTGLTCDVRPDIPCERDRTLQLEDVRILVDPKSFIYLHGMTLDYNQGTFPQGFIVVSAEQASSTGCGCASVPQAGT
jgi:iron-sulfur cluster assembly protein